MKITLALEHKYVGTFWSDVNLTGFCPMSCCYRKLWYSVCTYMCISTQEKEGREGGWEIERDEGWRDNTRRKRDGGLEGRRGEDRIEEQS